YGSREVGALAIECGYKKGLHYFPWSHYIEIIDSEIYITVLTNYSMPLIRYQIGDTGLKIDENKRKCKCGRNTLFFKEVTGRTISHFKNEKGEIIHGQYFIHLFYFKDMVRKFQIIQHDYDLIECKIAGNLSKNEMEEITKKISIVMGNNCKVEFNFVKSIKPTKSGKYLYTISNVL
ncbi:MAG: phenylacetate--CoA ligase family protein, partial [Spirochaetes bacterium]|nr:phenylacetate--CoA ligase family protein [Spirochaetota bacterium]